MKSILKCVLAFFVFFSMVDLSAINLLRDFHFDTKTTAAISMSDVVKVQYDLLQQTKNVVANVCDNIAKVSRLSLHPPGKARSYPRRICNKPIVLSSEHWLVRIPTEPCAFLSSEDHMTGFCLKNIFLVLFSLFIG